METREGSRSEWKEQHNYQQNYPCQQKYMNKHRERYKYTFHKRRAQVMRNEGEKHCHTRDR